MLKEAVIKERLSLIKDYMYGELNLLKDKIQEEDTHDKVETSFVTQDSDHNLSQTLNKFKHIKHQKAFKRTLKAAAVRKYKQPFVF